MAAALPVKVALAVAAAVLFGIAGFSSVGIGAVCGIVGATVSGWMGTGVFWGAFRTGVAFAAGVASTAGVAEGDGDVSGIGSQPQSATARYSSKTVFIKTPVAGRFIPLRDSSHNI